MKSRWAALVTTVVVFLVYVANVPFYAGSSLGPRHSWRMEHGRLTVERSEVVAQKDLWIDLNSEGLRFGFLIERSIPGQWSVTVPLWAPLLLALWWLRQVWSAGGESAVERPRSP